MTRDRDIPTPMPEGAKPESPESREIRGEELCDAKNDSRLVACMLLKGHVKTIDDWHWASTETESSVKTNIFEQIVHGRETIRWRPHIFELSDGAARASALVKKLGKDIEDAATS